MVIQEFDKYAEETCKVVNWLLEDNLIKKIPSHKAGCSRSRAWTFVEPQTRIVLKTNNNLSELLNGESKTLVWKPEFVQAVSNRLQEGATWKVI